MGIKRAIDLRQQHIAPDALAKLTAAQANQLRVVPLHLADGALHVAGDRPSDELAQALEVLTGMPCRQRVATIDSLEWALEKHFPSPQWPEESLRAVQVRGILQVKGLMGYEFLVMTVGSAILARRDRVRIGRGWHVRLESRHDPQKAPISDPGEVPEPDRLYKLVRLTVEGLAEELQDPDEGYLELPMTFFGDRLYTCRVALLADEIVVDFQAD